MITAYAPEALRTSLGFLSCAATIGTIRKESGSWRFTLSLMAFEICFAWLVSTLVFQIGRLFL